MARKGKKPARAPTAVSTIANGEPPKPQRDAKGLWLPGSSGMTGIDAARARKSLNADTIREMHAAFREGGREAIMKVMKSQPAIFLKLLVLLVPRELEITQTTGVKGLTDQQLDDVIAKLEGVLDARTGELAKVIEAQPEPPSEPPPKDA